METSKLVAVTFVGGPRHGERELVELPHGRCLTVVREEETTLYEGHTWSGQDARNVNYTQAAFCPVGMSEAEYRRLLLTIPPEPQPMP